MKAIATKNSDITKTHDVEVGVITKPIIEIPHKTFFFKAVVKNAPNLLSAIPGIGNLASASLQTAIGTAIDYYDGITNERRMKELESFDRELDKRLSKLEIKDEAREYWEDTIVFKREDIIRKLMTEPGKGFDILLAEYVASALSNLTYPPAAKDLVLSTLLSIDSVDLKVFTQLDTQFKFGLTAGNTSGVTFRTLNALLNPQGIDSIMISRSLQRLESQDLVSSLTKNYGTLRDALNQRQLMEGEKSPQNYSQGGFIVSAFGRRFLRFLKLSD